MEKAQETVENAAEQVKQTAADAMNAVKEWSFELLLLQTMWTLFWEKACSTTTWFLYKYCIANYRVYEDIFLKS